MQLHFSSSCAFAVTCLSFFTVFSSFSKFLYPVLHLSVYIKLGRVDIQGYAVTEDQAHGLTNNTDFYPYRAMFSNTSALWLWSLDLQGHLFSKNDIISTPTSSAEAVVVRPQMHKAIVLPKEAQSQELQHLQSHIRVIEESLNLIDSHLIWALVTSNLFKKRQYQGLTVCSIRSLKPESFIMH